MKGTRNIALTGFAAVILLLVMWSCGGSDSKEKKEKKEQIEKARMEIKKEWNNAVTAYQRRTDLIRNLFAIAKTMPAIDQQTIATIEQALTDAKAADINDLDKLSQEDLNRYQKAQNQVRSSWFNLFSDGKEPADPAGFRELQSQLEGAENRISVARNDYNAAVRRYNQLTGDEKAPVFSADEGPVKAPSVKF
jgi:LemA protein